MTTWSHYTIRCVGCRRLTRLAADFLNEENAVANALGARETLAATARRIEYCSECNSGVPLPGEHPELPPGPRAEDTPYIVPPVDE